MCPGRRRARPCPRRPGDACRPVARVGAGFRERRHRREPAGRDHRACGPRDPGAVLVRLGEPRAAGGLLAEPRRPERVPRGQRRRGLRLRHAPGLRRRDARPRRHLLREHGEPQLRGLPADSRRLRPGLVEPEPASHAAGRRTLGRHREPGRDRARAPRGAAHPRRPRQLLAPRRAGLVARPAERRPGRWRGLLRPHADAALLHRPQRHRHLSALRERHRVAGRRASCRWAPRSTTTVRRAA